MLIKKIFGLFTAILFLMVGLVGCSEEDTGIHGAIHRIEYGDNVVYLFGSMHAGSEEWYPLANVVEDAMARADAFVLEFDMTMGSYSPEEVAALVALVSSAYTLPEGLTLADVLSEEVYNNLLYHLPSYGVDYEAIYRQNPVALAISIQNDVSMALFSEVGISPMNSVDFYVLNNAMERGVPILGLEPTMQQLRIAFVPDEEILEEAGFDSFTLEEIMEAAVADFVSRDDLVEAMGREIGLPDYYAANDLARINELFQPTAEMMESAYGRYMVDVLMNFRSTYYANEIAYLLQNTDEPTTFFVTVGLSHIIREGEHFTNIVEQLDLLGIEAVPIFE